LIFTKYIKAEWESEDSEGGGCIEPICPRGEHASNCVCQSNTWSCLEYNESKLSCEKCKESDMIELKIDDRQGDHCVAVMTWWLALIILCPILCCIFSCCFCFRTSFRGWCSKCKGCQKGYETCCTSIEGCFKVCVCYTEKKSTPCCCYLYCFEGKIAFKPFQPKQVISGVPPNVQIELQENQSMPQYNPQINAPPAINQQNNLNGIPQPIQNNNQLGGPQNVVYGKAIPMQAKMSSNLPLDTIDKPISGFEPQYQLNQNIGNQQNYAVQYYQPPAINPNSSNQHNGPVINSNQIVLDDMEPNYNYPEQNQNNPVLPS